MLVDTEYFLNLYLDSEELKNLIKGLNGDVEPVVKITSFLMDKLGSEVPESVYLFPKLGVTVAKAINAAYEQAESYKQYNPVKILSDFMGYTGANLISSFKKQLNIQLSEIKKAKGIIESTISN